MSFTEAETSPENECHKPDSHSFLDVRRSNLVAEVDNKLGELFNVDDVLGIVRVRVDDFCTACHLQRLLA